jgi:putative hydrolase of the HAD superfamily
MRKIETIFFDNWNTLVQAPRLMQRGSSTEIFHKYLKDRGLSVPYDRFVEAYIPVSRRQTQEADENGYIELDYEERLREVFRQLNLDNVDDLAHGAWMTYLQEWPIQTTFFDETPQVLEELQGKYRLGVITNYMHGPTCREVFQKLNYCDVFSSLVVSAEVGYRKPSKVIFMKALQEMSSDPDTSVMVGDMYEADIVGANAVGMRSVLIDIYDNQHDHYSEASQVIKNIGELPSAIEKLLNSR